MRKTTWSLLVSFALAATGVLVGPAGTAQAATVSIDLYAVAGTTTLPGLVAPVPVWGYNTTGAAATQPGGPTLEAVAGDTVQVTLHNTLATESTGLLFQGQDMIPDLSGVAASGNKTYTFTATRPGTYLYEAALLPNAQHQVAMGLYGALIVRPATAGQAYADASTAYDHEAVMLLSEIDPALNNRAAPATFDMRKYNPRYFLMNGKVYPNTDSIPVAAGTGRNVLLRYVNAGIGYHSMAVLGAHQSVIALDGNPLNYARRYVAETFGPGQTADAIVKVPATTDDRKLPVYDGNLLQHNSNVAGTGGMLTFLAVAGTGPGADTTGPGTTNALVTPTSPTAGDLSATIDDTTTGGSTVQTAEYFVDTVGAAGTGTALTGTFGGVSANVTLTGVAIPSGQHIYYVRGQDSLGNWGVFSSVLVSGADLGGPTTSGPKLTPAETNGSVDVAVAATGDDTLSGGSTIAAAEYFIDTVGAEGTGTAMAVNNGAQVASLDATIPAAVVNALTEGNHVVSIHSQDAQLNWGAAITVMLKVDKTGPNTSGVTVNPTPNNGTLKFSPSIDAVRVYATLDDPISGLVNSSISKAEAFIDTVGTPGTGIPLNASDGVFNTTNENAYTDIPLTTILQLTNGDHTISVRAKDVAGNWGPLVTATLRVDKVRPLVSAVNAAPNPTQGASPVALTATATDTLTNVTRAEWFTGADPGVGNGHAMAIAGTGPWSLSDTINVSNWNEGAYTLNVRVKDAAGNWSVLGSTVLQVTGPLYFSTFGNTNPPGVAGTADDSDIYNWSGTAYSRNLDVSAAPYNLPTTANVDGFDRVDATHFYMSFSGNVNVPGIAATVDDEDVVYWNGAAWSVFFNGTAQGLTAANQDLDAISIGAGGNLFFSTVGNTNPTGVTGAADDADIYSWNGSVFARQWDASANGLAAGANVDGLVWADPTHFYLSFSADTTVPGQGVVQDEDVVHNNGGTWSVYFNGTAHGLTSGNLDVDAFDVP